MPFIAYMGSIVHTTGKHFLKTKGILDIEESSRFLLLHVCTVYGIAAWLGGKKLLFFLVCKPPLPLPIASPPFSVPKLHREHSLTVSPFGTLTETWYKDRAKEGIFFVPLRQFRSQFWWHSPYDDLNEGLTAWEYIVA